ncbi:peptide ABC transporter substrate-binding protein [Balneatrix alpica]|uniref:Peptide ABC transporter substrate-binding protein n=1 Tax=Balneatrix alpica TaxID=75684 RepID=A0ABV5ZBR1_9GAMM|nr:peptide ABC transporter substrate-binding protein [Balneatrix alpica]
MPTSLKPHTLSRLSTTLAPWLVSAALMFSPLSQAAAMPQQLTLNNGAEVSSLDPHKLAAEPDFNIGKDLFDGLVSQDADGKIIPALAISWQSFDDNTRYVFKLRPDAKWSNGDPITAADFVYSFQRLLDPATASPYSWFAAIPRIKNSQAILEGKLPATELGVRAPDPLTLEVTLEAPVPFFVKLLSHPVMFPVHPASIAAHGDGWTAPGKLVSNGPFMLSSWDVNEKIVLVKNPNYWNAAEVKLEQLTFLPIGDAAVALKRYLAGELDVLMSIPSEQLKKMQAERPQELIEIAPSLHSSYYELNTQLPPTDDVRVRKALAYAINRDALTQYVTANGELASYSLLPPQIDGFAGGQPAYAALTQAERESLAKQLISEAGYSADKPLKFSMVIPSFKGDQKVALALVNMWQQVLGAEVEVTKLEPKVFYATKSGYHVYRGGWVADYNEPSTFLDVFGATGSNKSGYANPSYQSLLDQAKTAQDPSQLYQQAEAMLTEDFPLIPLYRAGYQLGLKKPEVRGYSLSNPEQNYYRRDVYLAN